MSFANSNGLYTSNNIPITPTLDYYHRLLPTTDYLINNPSYTIFTGPIRTVGRLFQVNFDLTITIPATTTNPSIRIQVSDENGTQQQIIPVAYALTGADQIAYTTVSYLYTTSELADGSIIDQFKVVLKSSVYPPDTLQACVPQIRNLNIVDLGEFIYKSF